MDSCLYQGVDDVEHVGLVNYVDFTESKGGETNNNREKRLTDPV